MDAIRRVPKSDLHNHFFLGGNRALVSEWAGKDIAPRDHKLGCMAEMTNGYSPIRHAVCGSAGAPKGV